MASNQPDRSSSPLDEMLDRNRRELDQLLARDRSDYTPRPSKAKPAAASAAIAQPASVDSRPGDAKGGKIAGSADGVSFSVGSD